MCVRYPVELNEQEIEESAWQAEQTSLGFHENEATAFHITTPLSFDDRSSA